MLDESGINFWQVGDVIQCFLDCTERTMSFGLNGKVIGPIFEVRNGVLTETDVQDVEIGRGLYPSFSTNLEHECTFNFGEEPFK